MRFPSFFLLLASLLLTSISNAQLQWSKQDFGGKFEQTDRADFNGDGFPDLLDYRQIDFAAIEINSGKGTDGGGSSIQLHADSVAFLDFNRDNKIDVAGCNSSENLFILGGNGDGTVTPPQTITVPCSWVVAADFNRDGNPDIAVGVVAGASSTTTNQVIVYLGDGHGAIASQVLNDNVNFTSNDGDPCSISGDAKAGNFTGNKIPDIFIIARCVNSDFTNSTNAVIVGEGDGTGHFTFHKDLEGNFPVFHLRLVDENQDSKSDLFAQTDNAVGIFSSHGDGTFALKTAVHTNYSPTSGRGEFMDAATIADFDSDGINDLIVDIANIVYPFPSRYLRFYKGQSDGSYKATQTFPVADSVNDMISGDFDKDGRADLLMSRPNSSNNLWLNISPGVPSCNHASGLRSITSCTSGSPTGNFHFISSPFDGHPINAIQIYVDGALKFETPEDLLNKNLQLTDGAHRVTVKAWDDLGPFSTTKTLITCLNASNRTVRICSPEDGATVAGQVRIVASAFTNLKFSTLQVYIDGVLHFIDPMKSIDETFIPSRGMHHITVKGWDSDGPFFESVTVAAQ
jgi:hypothetical protein